MCGIAGILSKDFRVDKLSLVKKMSDSLSHRGPDGEGRWLNVGGEVAFGHRRLSIIDLSENGYQPMHYANGRYTIVFNGEIYNYIELRNFLLENNYTFKSKCDTEVILAMYDWKGVDCLQDLNGMFAFAIWDDIEKKLLCARDRFGEKPFFYHHVRGQAFYFASEMKALWSAGISKRLDEHRVYDYLKCNSIYGDDRSSTFYKGISQLDSGHYMVINEANEIQINRYYSFDNIKKDDAISEKEAADHLLHLLRDSVKIRLRSDVPVGSSLSGGLDSSTIVKLIDNIKAPGSIQKSFSARFHGYEKDEGYFIHKVVESCSDIQNHEVWPTHEEMEADIERLIYYQEEPFASASIFAQWKVMELAHKENVTVLLDGQGADEYLAGYLPYYELYINELYYNRRSAYHTELQKYNDLRFPKVIRQHQTIRQRIGRARRKLLGQQVPYTQGVMRSQLKKDTLVDGLKGLLRYADRNSMAHSREVRLPFLDHRVVEFVFSLPDSFLLRDGWTKWILRQAISDLLPKEVVWRVEKVGFEPPQTEWLNRISNNGAKKAVVEFLNDNGVDQSKTGGMNISDWNIFMLNKMIN